MTEAIYSRIEEQFKNRAKEWDLKPGSMAYKKHQAHFFSGAMAAMVAVVEFPDDVKQLFTDVPDLKARHGRAMPPKWVFGIMGGDDLIKAAPVDDIPKELYRSPKAK
jgi:hypothetical protein